MTASPYQALDAWVDAHFDEQVKFLQELVRVPTDTPPGNNAPHAERTAELLQGFGFQAEKHPVPTQEVKDYGLQSLTNLIVRRPYGPGPTIALNAHGDVVPPGEGWTHDPYGGEVVDGKLYGRASAVSKCDFSTYTFAVRALESLQAPLKGGVELHFTYDEEFGGELGPGWLLKHKLTKPDLLLAAAFSYQVVTAHNGCLQMEVTRARQDGPCGGARHRGGRAAGGDEDPERAVPAEHPVQAGDERGARHHPPLPERRPHRRRHQHQRRAGQGADQAGPAHDPRGEPGRGGSHHPPRHRRCGGRQPRRVAWTSSASCWPTA